MKPVILLPLVAACSCVANASRPREVIFAADGREWIGLSVDLCHPIPRGEEPVAASTPPNRVVTPAVATSESALFDEAWMMCLGPVDDGVDGVGAHRGIRSWFPHGRVR